MTEFRRVPVGEVELNVAIQGEGPLVVMVHGFPESWYSWRHQMGPIAAAGFTACAIDVRGYGGSDKPHPIEAYDLESLSGDVAGLIEALSPDQPGVVIGHDWGAPVAWTTALVHPERVRAVAGLSVPYTGVPTRSLSDIIDAVYKSKGRFFYQDYFAAEGVAEAELEADVRGAVRRLYYAWGGEAPTEAWRSDKRLGDRVLTGLPDPDPFPAWLSDADIDFMVSELERSGFRGGLNRYRNHDRDFTFLRQFQGRRIEQPALFIAGDRDSVLSMFGDRLSLMTDELPDLRGAHMLPGCGHWTQQERPEEVNNLLLPWLTSL
ncbi:alpha/beta fold hydrolase [Phenylobacterium sp.]|uniref:alpha/beta fold hydrolase n=1 Tax=Phenylobacterium sp. TaxID=1871053 RepID=UPI0027369D1B|nr:alpha/beta hydrolase [Phenylobacterium sp.]MDP3853573.1 alpha/beta hydrolase [Phenylobacterium sp.]